MWVQQAAESHRTPSNTECAVITAPSITSRNEAYIGLRENRYIPLVIDVFASAFEYAVFAAIFVKKPKRLSNNPATNHCEAMSSWINADTIMNAIMKNMLPIDANRSTGEYHDISAALFIPFLLAAATMIPVSHTGTTIIHALVI
jgi:hypothetical protein